MDMVASSGRMMERVRRTEQVLHDALRCAGRVDSELGAALAYAVFPGGKRWRPLLVLTAAELASSDWETALPAAGAIELLHSCSLVFDDLPCMDDAPMRRGRPALHVRFGDGLAILAGIGLLTTAYRLLARSPRPRQAVRLASRYVGPRFVLGGQAIDLRMRGRGPSPVQSANGRAVADLRFRKTSGLVTLALRAGALHGHVTRYQARALAAIGREIGIAFQLADDLSDRDGDDRAASHDGSAPASDVGRAAVIAELSEHVERAVALLHSAFPPSDTRAEMTMAIHRIAAFAAR